MAKSTISKLVSSRSVVMFRPLETAIVGSYSRFFNTKSCRENDCEYNYNVKIRSGSTSDVRDLFNDAFCHRLPATRNLTRLLNLMDESIRDRVTSTTPCGYPRWDVTQDAKAFYLVRNMFGLPNKDVNESVEIDHLGSWHVFGCVRVHFDGNMIKIIVGKNGPDPGAAYEGYVIRIYFGSRFCKPRDVEMDVQNEVLKITIPKKEGKWLHTITTQIKFFSPE